MLFDTHCHLNDPQLLDRVDEVIEAANNAGVTHFLVVGWDKESSFKAVELAQKYKNVYAAVGFHPCNIENLSDEDFYETLNLCTKEKVVAIGEIGLDYHWVKDPQKQEIQKEYFVKQIHFANEHKLPIIIHNRDAFNDCLKTLNENKPEYSGSMHCYSGSVEQMRDVFNLNLYIGLDGPVTFTNAKTPKAVAEEVPLEKLILETDSPYLAPHPLRGTINEPKNLGLVLDEIARLKDLSKKHIADVTFNNSIKLFGIKL